MIHLFSGTIKKALDSIERKKKIEEENRRRQELINLIYTARQLINNSASYKGNHPVFTLIKHLVDIELHRNINISLSTREDKNVKDYSISSLVPFPPDNQAYYHLSSGDGAYLFKSEFKTYSWFDFMKENTYSNQDLHVRLGYDPVIACPWNCDRLTNAFMKYGDGKPAGPWTQDNNHKTTLCLPMGITFVENGNHSITSGIVNNEGVVRVNSICDLTNIYHHLYTDGVHYFRTNDDSMYAPVKNYNFAVLFEIGRAIANNSFSLNGNSIRFKDIDIFQLKYKDRY